MVLRLNLRFCGPGKGLARRSYHCGVSEDTRAILEWAKLQYPGSPVTQIGFSLGGNISLKMAGEDGSRPSGNLDSVVAVNPPLDLQRAAERMGQPENRLFERTFIKSLLADVKLMQQMHPEIEKIHLPANLTIRGFDDLYTTRIGGFRDAFDYYKQCSSINYLGDIKVPTLILSSMDDPVVDGRLLGKVPHLDNLDVILTEHGGHIGFLGFGTSYDEIRWSDQAITRWLEDTVAI